MKCSCCGEQKFSLQSKKSALIRGTSFQMCKTCIKEGKEPRYAVILAGRRHGSDFVSDYIVKRRYCGETILAEEVITSS